MKNEASAIREATSQWLFDNEDVVGKAVDSAVSAWLANNGEDAIHKAVCAVMSSWLAERSDVTMPDIMEDAFKKAMSAWLDANRDTIIETIAKKNA